MAEGAEEALVVPNGWQTFDRRGPYSTHNGPFYQRVGGEAVEHGFHVLGRHCNGMGIVHGGHLASFIDGMLGHAASGAAKRMAVTVHLSLNYLSMARAGDWVQGEARVTRVTSDLVFAEARAFCGARDLVRATAVFKPMKRRREED